MKLIKITVNAGARKEAIAEKGDRLVIDVREPAEDGRANARILEIIRARFPGKPVRIIHGHRASHKTVSVG